MSPSAPTNHIGFQHSHRFLVSMLISRKDNLIFLTKYDQDVVIHILLFVYLLQLMFKFKSSVFPNIWHTSILDYLPNVGKKTVQKVGLSTKEIWSKPLFYNWCVGLTQVWRNQTKQWINMRLQYKTIVAFKICITVCYEKKSACHLKNKWINFLYLKNC